MYMSEMRTVAVNIIDYRDDMKNFMSYLRVDL